MTEMTDASLIIGYGSDMGTAHDAALSFVDALNKISGGDAKAIELNQIELADLRSATHFIAVTSTFGDGEFPDNAALFWEALSADTAEPLNHVRFAVLAFGDSGHDHFCNAGRLLDQRLADLGATRLADRVDVDGPYTQPATTWIADVVKLLAAEQTPAAPAVAAARATRPPADAQQHGRDRVHPPVEARIAVNRPLTAPASDKEVRHYELDLTDAGISYTAGDSIAVHASNDPELVEAILAELGVGPDHEVLDHDQRLGSLLTDRLEIRNPSRALQALTASRTSDPEAATEPGKDVLDLIRLGGLTVDEVVDTLRPLEFRDYSIASSPLVYPERVHLTVATVRYTCGRRRYGGVASTFLADRGETVRVHLRTNPYFRLPAADVPIIMIGPGTGIAPFRAFLQERQASGATGPSWLFFGDRRRATDFLYGEELTGFLESGSLTRLDLAFSRDGRAGGPPQYVQDRMWENAAQFFEWLEDGAHLYVCGDAERMARDVEAMVHKIVAHHGKDDATAHAYVNRLIKNHRYVRDVY